ncbi:two-component system OmpR family sensor kinase [Thermosporothrix hazakensis]|uniref:histidine kinase n=1 Tax=Thermosporothrix hazakensis TaxID=644383 RepID=A0A326U2D2_THEHA|nr:HAMP domain-containing sensor histidine kinase [Thermosporothrix hazakensis]PZW24183.1 two-component system OmpR family sensor kinase [Thermosporothrix hazakensis]GCE47815.1 hypothetical protein KTH_26840 [Thermosporothrix hazakensis]
MPEPRNTRTKEQPSLRAAHSNGTHPSVPMSTPASLSPSSTEKDEGAHVRPHSSVPAWLQPFSSLRVQLATIYSLLLLLAVVLVYTLAQTNTLVTVVAILIITLGVLVLAWLSTFLLLRPLSRITDTAQAIALGDLKQRQRLPLRRPPQDEIDRLAGSLHEMVTRLEHAEELQHAAEERFRRFFTDASHQLRTPLTSIRGFTEVLLRGAKDDPETAQRILHLMKNENERMTNLINDLLMLARLDGRGTQKVQFLDLRELAQESIEQVRIQTDKKCTISLHAAAETRFGFKGNREHLKQLFLVLLDNAVKYGCTEKAATILLSLEQQQNHTVIQIIDHGPGIPEDELTHIFDSFYRGQHQRIAGTGLGLAIATAIVEAHHGTITAESEIGKGTTFTVKLPLPEAVIPPR